VEYSERKEARKLNELRAEDLLFNGDNLAPCSWRALKRHWIFHVEKLDIQVKNAELFHYFGANYTHPHYPFRN
jgi:hypothetical protein